MQDLKQKGRIDRILFVTWTGRIGQKSGLRNFLNNSEVEVIEKEEAPVGGHHNIWHQMRALEFGLKEVSQNSRVLKTRTDVHINQEFLERLFSNSIKYRDNISESGIFSERIWTPFFSIEEPFFISDLSFFGTKSDLMKLINYDARYDFLYNVQNALPEIRRFIHPYLEKYDFLENYLLKYPHRGENHVQDRRGLVKSRLNSTVYGSFFAFYYKIMLEDFYVEFDPMTFYDSSLDEVTWDGRVDTSQNFMNNFIQGPESGRHHILCGNTSWLQSHFRGEMTEDIPSPVVNGIKRPFNNWVEINFEEDMIMSDLNRDKKFFDTTEYPDNIIVNLLQNKILGPVGMTTEMKHLYRVLFSN
jgi:hypothetical protein